MFYEFCVGFGNQSKQIWPGHKVQLINDMKRGSILIESYKILSFRQKDLSCEYDRTIVPLYPFL